MTFSEENNLLAAPGRLAGVAPRVRRRIAQFLSIAQAEGRTLLSALFQKEPHYPHADSGLLTVEAGGWRAELGPPAAAGGLAAGAGPREPGVAPPAFPAPSLAQGPGLAAPRRGKKKSSGSQVAVPGPAAGCLRSNAGTPSLLLERITLR